MPSIVKVPLPYKEAVLPFRAFADYFDFNSFFNYRTLSKAYPCANGYESNHFGVVQAMFRKQAPKLEASKFNTNQQIRWFLDRLPLKADSVVLDMNCGTGIVSRHLAPHVKSVHGTDISRHLVEYAKTRPIDNVEITRAESSELPFEDSTFDIVFSRLSFNHISHRLDVINEMRRVCKPGGYIALLDRIVPADLDDFTVLRMEYIEGTRDASHVYFMSPAEMLRLFQENSIEVQNKELTVVHEPFEEYLAQTNVIQADRAAISQYVYGNLVAPDADQDQTTGFYPHLVDDVITLTHHLAFVGGLNPTEKPTPQQQKE